ncbi:MAG: hypothetical protein ABJO09_02420 [Hyphomicrobiales bacterium]
MLSVVAPLHTGFTKSAKIIALFVLALSLGTLAADARDRETDFLAQLQGTWSGTGRVLAGPDRGTDFKCALKGKPSRTGVKISMDGKCSIGRLSARMGASIKYSHGVQKYIGRFLGGAKANGMDIYGDRRGNALKLRLSRGRTQGNMDLLLQKKDVMRVIISVTDSKRGRDIPVIALNLNKTRSAASLAD